MPSAVPPAWRFAAVDEKYLEQASAITEHLSSDALADVRRALEGNGQSDCEDCGDVIPSARRQAMPSAIRCVNCQTQIDFFNKGYQR
jgi:phage/conjugal plasmid C-4 type zinc finger TraR family protein